MNTEQRDFALRLKEYIYNHSDKVYMDSFVTDIYEADKEGDPKLGELTCGTVGCIAGTACFLADGKWCRGGSDDRAKELLGLRYAESYDLFYFPFREETYPVYEKERKAITRLAPGSRAYARVVAEALQKCIDRNYKE